MLEAISYTIVAIVLYLVSDWILQRMEVAAGRRFEYRSLIFFFILTFLAITSFSLIRNFL